MEDKTVTCIKCGKEFVFTKGEQEFYQTKGLYEPKKCKECRDEAKREKQSNRR